jgi:hypothetical protein
LGEFLQKTTTEKRNGEFGYGFFCYWPTKNSERDAEKEEGRESFLVCFLFLLSC